MIRALRILAASAVLLIAAGCRTGSRDAQPADTANAAPPAVTFVDATAEAGLRFQHETGAAGRKWMPETMGSGAAFFDYDGDGWQDLLLLNGMRWPGASKGGPQPTMALYRNRGNGVFEDVTARIGLDRPLYGMGAAAADYDGDGDQDVCVTHLGGVTLFRNDAKRFVVAQTGITNGGWPTSAAWLDYDRDGYLDLFVGHYVPWTPQTDVFVSLDGVNKTYARPTEYPGDSCRLYRGLGPKGKWRFEDVTRRSGVYNSRSKALGVALCDYDQDGRVDIVVANDTQQNFLYHNQGNGTFSEVARVMGIAVTETGIAKAGMGVDTADILNNGREAILVTNFSGEQLTLYQLDEYGLFQDVSARSGLGPASSKYLGFGTFFFDYDLDGRQDVFVANGHIQEDAAVRNPEVTYAQPALLFRNLGDGQFRDLTGASGAALMQPVVARGAAYGDYDNDGDLDVVVNVNGGPARLLRNENRTGNRWLRVELTGAGGNRDAIGARVRIKAAGLPAAGASLMARSGSSYLSSHDRRLLFGLGTAERADAVEIQWPNGSVQSLGPAPAGQTLRVTQSPAQ